MKKPRILLADDHRMVAEGLRGLLELDYDLVGIVEDGRALLEAADRLMPDVVVADVSMPLLNGIEAVRQLKKKNPDVAVVFLTMHMDVAYAASAFEAGAAGYVLKHSAPSDGAAHRHRLRLEGRTYITPLLAGELLTYQRNRPAGEGTPGERPGAIDHPPARGAATDRRGAVGERGRGPARHQHAHGGVPQVQHDGGPGLEEFSRVDAICGQARHQVSGTSCGGPKKNCPGGHPGRKQKNRGWRCIHRAAAPGQHDS